ncbi:streptophobe family protein [Streptomyces sp. NPDC058867]|uniref:streptophobe family protein n=1 Tax=unclassified Streptomyces TaxID=2593676 RepID=UPI0036C3AA66
MTATTPRPRTGPGSGPRPHRRTEPVRLVTPWRHALEGAGATVCAVAAMLAVSALALKLLDATSYADLWPMALTLTSMAVGGSVVIGPSGASESVGAEGGLAALFGGGATGPSLSGALQVVPLGITLAGALLLWILFSWRLGGRRRHVTAGGLSARVVGAATAAAVTLMIVAGLAEGTATLPPSAVSELGVAAGSHGGDGGGVPDAPFGGAGGLGDPFGGAGGPGELFGGAGGLGELFGGGAGGGPTGLLGGDTEDGLTAAHSTGVGSTGFGGVVWATVVIGVGCLISRRVRLPLGGVLDRLRSGWGPSLSALVRGALVLTAVLLGTAAVLGVAGGGRAAVAAGAALLLAPNALGMLLTMGVGSSWTAEIHPVQVDSGSNPLAGLLGATGGSGGHLDRTEHLRTLAVAGCPLWLAALTVTVLVLLGCAFAAARATRAGGRSSDQDGPALHFAMAQQFGLVTAVVLGASTWLVQADGQFGVSVFGAEIGGTHGTLSGSVAISVALGLVLGALAGFTGSVLSVARGDRGTGSDPGATVTKARTRP